MKKPKYIPKKFTKVKSMNIDNLKCKSSKEFDEVNIKNTFNEYVQFIQGHGWIYVKDELPPKGSGLCVVAMWDTCANYGMAGEVMNSTWFCNNYKKKGWTHWMLLPPRPSEMNNIMEHLFNGTAIQND